MEHQPQRYIAVTLERPYDSRWGLSLSFFQSKHLILGCTHQADLVHRVTGLFSCECPIDPSPFWHPAVPLDVSGFIKHLLATCPSKPLFASSSLTAGDCILAINYRSVSGFANMEEITHVFATCHRVVLLVLRSPMAVRRACTISQTPTTTYYNSQHLAPTAHMASNVVHYYEQYGTAQPMLLQEEPDTLPQQAETEDEEEENETHVPLVPGALPAFYRNPLFLDSNTSGSNGGKAKHLPYADDHEYQTDEGERAALFLRPIQHLECWLSVRKNTWRKRYRVYELPTVVGDSAADHESSSDECCDLVVNGKRPQHHHKNPFAGSFSLATSVTSNFRNPLFRDKKGDHLPFCDDILSVEELFNVDPDSRARLFLRDIPRGGFHSWLATRKRQWRQTYHTHELHDDEGDLLLEEWDDPHEERTVATDFWTRQGYSTFHHWLATSSAKWKTSYSWNKKKRKRIEQDCEEVVHLSDTTLHEWLRVRKNQWRVLRRKRQRQQRQESITESIAGTDAAAATPSREDMEKRHSSGSVGGLGPGSPTSVIQTPFAVGQQAPLQEDFAVIDALLEDRERQQEQEATKKREPFDLTLLMDPNKGTPDDVVVHFLEFLVTPEHCALLCLNKPIRKFLTERIEVWKSLCPSRWKLPRRPRKQWYELYFLNLRTEKEKAQKRFDDLLSRAAQILHRGDQLNTIDKMVTKAEREFEFDVNYSSGVVCERNSLLNLATIHKRHKVVRWLVETKRADIESRDRGGFTPLLNAAWAGDKFLVRFLLQKGADRSHRGKCHYTKPLAPPDFKGRTASGWASHRGHHDIAKLIELGL